MSTAVAIILFEDLDRGRCGRGTCPVVLGAAGAAEAADADASNVAMEPMELME